MQTLSKRLRKRHLIQDRKTELFFALFLFIIGAVLLYDAFDARGKELPWPASVFAPW